MFAKRFRRPRVRRPSMVLEQLEERIVLDASGDAGAQDDPDQNGADSDQTPEDSQESASQTGDGAADNPADSSDPLEQILGQDLSVVLISNCLDQVDALSSAVVEDAETILLDWETDDLGTVVELLAALVDSTGQQIGHLAIISHGTSGMFSLGESSWHSLDTIDQDAANLSALGNLLSDSAVIDLYGCSIGYGEQGVSFVNSFADATGATVRASDDATGSGENLDWDLEVHSAWNDGAYLIDAASLAVDFPEGTGSLAAWYNLIVLPEGTLDDLGNIDISDYSATKYVYYDPETDGLTDIIDKIEAELPRASYGDTDAVAGIIFLTDGAPGVLVIGTDTVTWDDIDEDTDPDAQQFTRLAEIVAGYNKYSTFNYRPGLHLFGSEIAKGTQGEQFVDRIADLTGLGDPLFPDQNRMAVRASDDLTGRMFASFGESVDWELEYLDSDSAGSGNPFQQGMSVVMNGFSCEDSYYYDHHYYVFGRFMVVGEGDSRYQALRHEMYYQGEEWDDIYDDEEDIPKVLWWDHDTYTGVGLKSLTVTGMADINIWDYNDDDGYVTDAEWITIVVNGELMEERYNSEDDIPAPADADDEQYFRFTFDYDGDEISLLPPGTPQGIRIQFTFGGFVDLADWDYRYEKRDDFQWGYYYFGYCADPDDEDAYDALDSGNFARIFVQWNPSPEAITDMHVDVEDRTNGNNIELTNVHLVDYEGIVSYAWEYNGYDTSLFKNVYFTSTGIRFDTVELTGEGDVTSEMVFYAIDAEGVMSRQVLEVTILQQANADDFFAQGMQRIPIDLDGWGVTDRTGDTVDPLTVIIRDAPDHGDLFYADGTKVEGSFAWSDRDGIYYDGDDTYWGSDSFKYSVTYRDGGKTKYSGWGLVELNLEENPGIYEVGTEDHNEWISDWGQINGDWHEVEIVDLSDLEGKGQLRWYRDGSSTHTLSEGDICIIDGIMGEFHYFFDPDPNFYGSATFTYMEFGEERIGEFFYQPVNDAPTISGTATVSETEEGSSPSVTGLEFGDWKDLEWTLEVLRDDFVYLLEIDAQAADFLGERPYNLSFDNGLAITYDDQDETWKATGSLTQLNEAFSTGEGLLLVTKTGYEGFNGDVTLTVTLDDQGNVGGDQNLTVTRTVGFTVSEINSEPTMTAPDSAVLTEGTGGTIAGFSIADTDDHDWYENDAGDLVYRLEVSVVSDDYPLVDPFDLQFGNGQTLNYDGTTKTWWIEKDFDTLKSDVESGLTLSPADGLEDFYGPVTLSVTLDDLGNIGGESKTDTKDVSVTVTPVNQAPTVTGAAQFTAVSEGGSTTMTGVDFFDTADLKWLTETERAALDYRIDFTVEAVDWSGHHPFELSFENGLSVEYDADSHVWSAHGTLDDLNAALDSGLKLDTATGYDDFYGDVAVTATLHDQGNMGDGDLEVSVHGTFTVSPDNDEPTLTAPGSAVFTEGNGGTIIGLSIADTGDHDWYQNEAGELVYRLEISVISDKYPSVDPFDLQFGNGQTLNYDAATKTWWIETDFDTLKSDVESGVTLSPAAGLEDFHGPVTLSVTLADLGNIGGESKTDTQTVSVTVTPVNQAPTVTGTAQFTAVSEGGSTTMTGLDFFDTADLKWLTEAERAALDYRIDFTVEAVDWTGHHPFELSFENGLSVVYDAGSHVWSAHGTLDDLNDAFDSGLRLDTAAGYDDFYGDVAVTATLHDQGNMGGGDLEVSVDGTFTVSPVNDEPTLTAPASAGFTEGNGGAIIGFSIADTNDHDWYRNDAGDLVYRLELSVISDKYPSEHPFDLQFGNGQTLNYDGTTKTWWIEKDFDTLKSDVESGLTLSPAAGLEDFYGPATLSVTLDDLGNIGGASKTDTQTVSVTVTPVNQAPTVTGAAQFTAVSEGGSTIMTGVDFFDSADLKWLTEAEREALDYQIDFTVEAVDWTGHHPFELSFENGLSVAYDADSHVWSAHGTLDDLNDAFDSGLRLDTASGYEEFYGDVAVSMTLHDQGNVGGDDMTAFREDSFSVVAVNDGPRVTVPGQQVSIEDTPVVITGITVSDETDLRWAPDRDLEYTVTLTSTADDFDIIPGTLALQDDNGKITYIDSSDGTLVFTGYYDDVQAALANGVRFDPTRDFYGEVTISVHVDDQGHVSEQSQAAGAGGEPSVALTANGDVAISVSGVNDPPDLTVPGSQTMLEDGTLILEGLTLGDVDMQYALAGNGDFQVDIAFQSTMGSLALAETEGLSGDLDGADGILSFVGELDAINRAMEGMTYTPPPDYFGEEKLLITVNDLGNYGTGDPYTTDGAIDITVLSVPDLDELGKPDDYYSGPTEGSGSETGPLSSRGFMPAIGNLLQGLSTMGLLPFDLTGSQGAHTGDSSEALSQFGILMHGALFGDTPESQNQSWSNLISFVSGKKAHGEEEWLGLEAFLTRLNEWHVGKSVDEVFLVFNADGIDLVEWFNSLMSSGEDVIGNDNAAAGDTEDSVQQSLSTKAWVFDMAEIRVADLLSGDPGGNGFTTSQEPASEFGGPVCRVFDLRDVSLMTALAG